MVQLLTNTALESLCRAADSCHISPSHSVLDFAPKGLISSLSLYTSSDVITLQKVTANTLTKPFPQKRNVLLMLRKHFKRFWGLFCCTYNEQFLHPERL